MSILQNSIVPASAGGGYEIDNSIRLDDGSASVLTRTPASAGNKKTYTLSMWVKFGNIDNFGYLAGAIPSDYIQFGVGGDNKIRLFQVSPSIDCQSTAVLRDTAAWYHIMWVVDTTQATSSNRIKIYLNGELQSLSTATYPAQNADTLWNGANAQGIGGRGDVSDAFDGYLADVYFVDGQALDPSNFGETDETYGHWKAKAYEGTYGTNGFYLDFKNSGSLGNDVSGNGNNWTPNNLAANDQMLDSPTNNFATFNPLQRDGTITLSEGNTIAMCSSSSNWQDIATTMAVPVSGKWYWEFLSKAVNQWCDCGIVDANSSDYFGNTAAGSHISQTGNRGIVYAGWGQKGIDGVFTTYGASHTGNDTIGIAVDVDSNIITFYKNGVSQGSINSALVTGTTYLPAMQGSDSNGFVANFGQDSSFAGNKTAQGNQDDNNIGDFYYKPPTGYLALCTQNLPEPTVVPSENFNTVLYTGNGVNNTTTSRSLTGVGFQPSLIIHKGRSDAGDHRVWDAVRGTATNLSTNTTGAEWSGAPETVTSFDSDGFTLGSVNGDWNLSGRTYVAWNWKANGAGVSNTDGSITSTVSANVDAGFSIVSYTGNATTSQSVGHGLSSAPEMIIVRNRTDAADWKIYHTSLGTDYQMRFDTAAKDNAGTLWGSTTPTSSLFYINNDGSVNGSSDAMIAYCFHSVEGYSKVGSYTGNGSTDGPFVHCGFIPAYVMIKRTDASAWWYTLDAERNTYNVVKNYLSANDSYAEYSNVDFFDFTSNGFKLRTSNSECNASGGTYIFLAFAETPFKYTNAR